MPLENIKDIAPRETLELQVDLEKKKDLPESKPVEVKRTERESDTRSESMKAALSDAVTRLNKELGRDIHIEVAGKSEPVVVKVVESETGEVIRQIPAEHAIEISKRVEHLSGILFNEEV
ncbi:MAG: flagellar protein FlaG [Deltaproteobacteria bacterium]|nr:flagellar protein FlaG [Deltaproteobacteria bacterium]